jgi:hypothetical protein
VNRRDGEREVNRREGEGRERADLEVFVSDVLAGVDAVGDIEMDELSGEGHSSGEAIHNLHAVERHVHADQRREVV